MFQELGEWIQRAWRSENYNEDGFTRIVVEALRQSRFGEQAFTLEEYVTWLQDVEHLPSQGDFKAGLGQSPLIVFDSGRFYLGLYFWHDLVTAIHCPSAQDVFAVLRGRCLEARYSFEPSKAKANSHLLWGTLTSSEVRHHVSGSVMATDLQDIHSFYSLEEPTVVLVARTNAILRLRPEYTYHPPGVAVDSFYRDPLASRRVQSLALLSETDETQYLRLALSLVQTSDLETVYRVLEHLAKSGHRFPEQVARATGLAQARFGEVIELFMHSFKAHFREQLIREELRATKDPRDRLLWALTHIQPGRELVLKTLASHSPNMPSHEWVADWLEGFSTHTKDALRVDEVSALLVRRLFEGNEPGQAVQRLAQTYGAAAVGEATPQLLAQCAALRRHPVFSAFL